RVGLLPVPRAALRRPGPPAARPPVETTTNSVGLFAQGRSARRCGLVYCEIAEPRVETCGHAPADRAPCARLKARRFDPQGHPEVGWGGRPSRLTDTETGQ